MKERVFETERERERECVCVCACEERGSCACDRVVKGAGGPYVKDGGQGSLIKGTERIGAAGLSIK